MRRGNRRSWRANEVNGSAISSKVISWRSWVRRAGLETRTARLKLPVARKPLFIRIGPGLSLGYRRNQVAGTWVLRVADGKGGATTRAIGTADDFTEADGVNLLNYW